MAPTRRSTIGSSKKSSDDNDNINNNDDVIGDHDDTIGITGKTPKKSTTTNNSSNIKSTIKKKRNMKDDDIDDDDHSSINTMGSVISRQSERLKRKRMDEEAAAAANATVMNQQHQQTILNFDAVLEEEEENDDDDEDIDTDDDPKRNNHSKKNTSKQQSKRGRGQGHQSKRMKLSNDDNDDDDDDMEGMIVTTTDGQHDSSSTPMDVDQLIKNEDDVVITNTTTDENVMTILHETTKSSSTTMMVKTTDTTTIMEPSNEMTTTTSNTMTTDIPLPTTKDITTTSSLKTKNTIQDIATVHEGRQRQNNNNETNNNINEGDAHDDDNANDDDDTTISFGTKVYQYISNSFQTIQSYVCPNTDDDTNVVNVIIDTPTNNPIRQQPVLVPLYDRTSTWFIMLLLLQIIFYPLWFKYILTSTVSLSYILLDLYRIEKYYDKNNNNINNNNIITPITTTSEQSSSSTSESLRTAMLTLQAQEEKLKIQMAEEKEMYQKLIDITEQIKQMNITPTSIVSDDDDNDVEEMDEAEIASIQNRMDTLQPYIEYLESIQHYTGEELIQEQIQQQKQPKIEDDLMQQYKHKILDLSQNQFVLSLFAQQNDNNNNNNNISNENVECDNDSNTTTSNNNNNNMAEFVQYKDVEIALASLNEEIYDRIYSIIDEEKVNNDDDDDNNIDNDNNDKTRTVKDHVRNWIRTEIDNYIQNIKDKAASIDDSTLMEGGDDTTDTSSNKNMDIVKRIINERIMKVYGDITNRIDYASKYNGGIVLYSTLSLVGTLPIFNRIVSFLNLRFYGHTAQIAITPNYYNTKNYKTNSILGQCWSFIRIKPAMLMIQLAQTIHVKSVLIEHPLLSKDSTTTNTIRNSSIQTFHVYGHEETDKEYNTNHHHQSDTTRIITILNTTTHTMLINNGWYYLGTFHYDQSNILPGTNGLVEYPVLQNHQQQIDTNNDDESDDDNDNVDDIITKPIPPLRRIQLFIDPILDTTDPYEYTCLYRFRVHGTPI